jgi:hypothetical protein
VTDKPPSEAAFEARAERFLYRLAHRPASTDIEALAEVFAEIAREREEAVRAGIVAAVEDWANKYRVLGLEQATEVARAIAEAIKNREDER